MQEIGATGLTVDHSLTWSEHLGKASLGRSLWNGVLKDEKLKNREKEAEHLM